MINLEKNYKLGFVSLHCYIEASLAVFLRSMLTGSVKPTRRKLLNVYSETDHSPKLRAAST